MTTPDDVLDLAVPYALHALPDSERDELEARLAERSSAGTATDFYDEVRAVREAMAAAAVSTELEPPAALRDRILAAASDDPVRTLPTRRRTTLWAAAAAVVIGLGAVGIGVAIRPPPPEPSAAEQIFAAPDVRTVSGPIPVGGQATFVFSHDRNAGVLVMNNVPPPSAGTVYQMWLVGSNGTTSAGTMDAASVSPSTTAVVPDLGDSTALAFTVEPGTGSTQPTGEVFARLPLS